MIEAILWTPRFPVPKGKTPFRGCSSYGFLRELFRKVRVALERARGSRFRDAIGSRKSGTPVHDEGTRVSRLRGDVC